MSDSSMCTASHSSDDGGCPGTLQTGLREWCIGRPSGLPDAPTPVSPQCSCATDFSSEIQRPYYSLHWLRVRERIQYKLAVMAYKVLHGSAPSYLGPLVRVADVPGRRALREAGTNRILMPPVISTTVGSRAFPVAASLIWNYLTTLSPLSRCQLSRES